MPGQCLVRIGQWLAGTGRGLRGIDPGLLVGVEHFHQQAALGALRRQFAQQPQLQSVVIGVVVLFADQYPRRAGEALDQLLRGESVAGGEFTDHSQVGVVTPLRGDRRRRRQYVMGLAGRQQAEQAKQQKAHR
ncbi:hypothetical protein D3C71_1177950 [compost metagenome]